MQENQEVSRKLAGKAGSKHKHKKRYSFEFKLRAVKLYLEEGFKQDVLCQEMGMGTSTFSGWLREYRAHGQAGRERVCRSR
jgi:transposase-like protein